MGDDKFIQPIDGIVVTHGTGPDTLLSQDVLQDAARRVAAGEDKDKVLTELAILQVELEDELREDGLLPPLELPKDLREAEFNPDQPRDDQGKWSPSGASTAANKTINVKMAGGNLSDREKVDLVAQNVSKETRAAVENIAQAMTDAGDETDINFVGAEGEDRFFISISGRNHNRELEISIDFHEGETVANWEIVKFEDTTSPRQARATLASTLDAMDKLDVDRIELDAAMSDGGYLWARLGFDAATPKNFQAMAKTRTDDWRSLGFSREDADALRELIEKTGPIAGLPKIIADAPNGKKLLRGSRWGGTLNLRKPGALDRINHFLGRGRRTTA